MTGPPLRCSRRGTVCCPSPLRGFLHGALASVGCRVGKWRNQEEGWIVVVHPALDVSQASRDAG